MKYIRNVIGILCKGIVDPTTNQLFRTPRYSEDDTKANRSVKAGQLKPPSETSFVSIASAYEKSYAFRVGFEFRMAEIIYSHPEAYEGEYPDGVCSQRFLQTCDECVSRP